MKTLPEYIVHVAAIGIETTATTARGLLAAWRKHPRQRRNLDRAGNPDWKAKALQRDHLAAEKARKSDPDTKRAAKDKAFRAALLKRQRAEWARLTRQPQSAAEFLKFHADEPLRYALAAERTKLVNAGVRCDPLPPAPQPCVRVVRIGLSDSDKTAVRKAIGGSALDRVSWLFSAGFISRVTKHTYNRSRKSGRGWSTVTRARASHNIEYQSFIFVAPDGRTAEYMRLGKTTRWIAPEGHHFGIDEIGFGLVRTSDGRDWHPAFYMPPTASLSPEHWAQCIRDNDAARDAEEARKADKEARTVFFLRDLKTTRVTMHDSRAAGNCPAGTVAFGERLGYDPAQYNGLNVPGVSAAVLMRTKDSRAEAACWKAWERETLVAI